MKSYPDFRHGREIHAWYLERNSEELEVNQKFYPLGLEFRPIYHVLVLFPVIS